MPSFEQFSGSVAQAIGRSVDIGPLDLRSLSAVGFDAVEIMQAVAVCDVACPGFDIPMTVTEAAEMSLPELFHVLCAQLGRKQGCADL